MTCDVEIAEDHDLGDQTTVLCRLAADLDGIGLPVTFFTSSDAAQLFRKRLFDLRTRGHEIGSHGVSHERDEDYSRLPPDRIDRLLHRSTTRIRSVGLGRPTCFRGPFMTTSTTTQRALVREGYVGDFSVCSQRLDIRNCRGGRLGWWFAPRGAYRPHERSPFRRRREPLLVVPLSCVGIPFLSGVLYLLGERFMRAVFSLLLAEARRSGAPIVYLFHSYEFARPLQDSAPRTSPPSVYQRLYARDRAWRYDAHMRLLEHMARHHGVRPQTASAFVRERLEAGLDTSPGVGPTATLRASCSGGDAGRGRVGR